MLERRRIRLWPLVARDRRDRLPDATVPIQLDYPYYEALGFSILDLGNRELWLPQSTLQRWVVAIAVIGGALLLGACTPSAAASPVRAASGRRSASSRRS